MAGLVVLLVIIGLIAWGWKAGAAARERKRQALEDYNNAISAARSSMMLEHGHASLPIIDPAQVAYRPVGGEKLIAVQNGAVRLEMRSTGRYSTSGSSVSVRIAKGVRYRVGGGTVTTERRLLPTGQGRLLITDKAVVFEGSQRNERITWPQIASAEVLSEGFQICRRSGPPRLYQVLTPDPQFAAVLQIMLLRTA